MKQTTSFMRNFFQNTNDRKIIAVVGAGGKTSLIHQLASEFLSRGEKVFVTTSTHMLIEADTLLTDKAEEIIAKLEGDGYAMAGIQEGVKIKELSEKTYKKVCEHADVVLIEADGSKHMPLKFPGDNEPVIYENVTDIIIVWGKHALGKPAKEVCHRLELTKSCLGITDDTLITMEHAKKLVQKGYVEPLGKKYPKLHLHTHCYIIDK